MALTRRGLLRSQSEQGQDSACGRQNKQEKLGLCGAKTSPHNGSMIESKECCKHDQPSPRCRAKAKATAGVHVCPHRDFKSMHRRIEIDGHKLRSEPCLESVYMSMTVTVMVVMQRSTPAALVLFVRMIFRLQDGRRPESRVLVLWQDDLQVTNLARRRTVYDLFPSRAKSASHRAKPNKV